MAALAQEEGWNQDAPSNLIALPSSERYQLEFAAETGGFLPVHRGSHPKYDGETTELIEIERKKYPKDLRSIDAKSILNEAAKINRANIISGKFGNILKVEI